MGSIGATPSGEDRFEIRRRLGAGGMGVVYESIDRTHGSRVALKTLLNVDPGALFRFKNEFRALADLRHPNLVALHELFSVGDEWFFTMELVDGVDFIRFVRDETSVQTAITEELSEPRLAVTRSPPASKPKQRACFREHALRAALLQLVRGVEALHGAGKLHRDLKPSNILVDADGRVVICDFGLVVSLAPDPMRSSTGRLVGTAAYMAPEQAAAGPLGPAADFYSVGVVLYEALTGRLPHDGTTEEILARKTTVDPEAPSALADGVPADLDALCMKLLARDPDRRPSGPNLLHVLGDRQASRAAITTSHSPAPFVGRARELQALRDAFTAARNGHTAIASVHGPSGIGKSALVRRFLDEVEAESGALVLAGRCWERESLPYKTVDGVIDTLGGYLDRLSVPAVEELLPPDVSALARLFPALRRVQAIAQPAMRRFLSPDPHELRRRGSVALQQICAAVARQRPLVIWIDDLQWGDVDGAALLADLAQPSHDAGLIILSYRSEDADAPAVTRALASYRSAVHDVPLGALTDAESEELSLSLLSTVRRDAARLVARESLGSPFLALELARHLRDREGIDDRSSLGEVLRARLRALPPPAARLLALVAVAGRPITLGLLRRAADLGPDHDIALTTLRSDHLVRTQGIRETDRVEMYHDRIRETAVALLDAAELRDHHRRLAAILARERDPDPEAILEHLLAAGDRDKAAELVVPAAENAARALAFDRAASRYRLAIELRAPTGAERCALFAALGEALENAGLSADAGQAYLSAAEVADVGGKLDLRRRAAEQLLRSGHVDQGFDAVREVLAEIGLELAATPRSALLSLAWNRVLVRFRGLRFVERDKTQIAPEILVRIDACRTVSLGIGLVDMIRGADFQARHLRLALAAGEPSRITRALCLEAVFAASSGGPGRARTRELVARATELADRLGEPQAIALARGVAATAAYLFGEWRTAVDGLRAAEQILRDECTGVAWELASAHIFSLASLFYLGELDQLASRVPALLAEAEARGDLYLACRMRSSRSNAAWLVRGRPDEARFQVEESIRRWPREGFHIQHYYQLLAHTNIDLYQGDGATAWRRLREAWEPLERSFLFRVQQIHIEMLNVEGRAALAAWRDQRDDKMLRVAERCARRIDKERMAWARPLVCLLRAGVHAARAQYAEASAALAAAAESARAADMQLHAAAAELARAALDDGDATAASRWLAGQGVREPDKLCAMIVPGTFTRS